MSFDYATEFGDFFVLVIGRTNNMVSFTEDFFIGSSGFTTQDSSSDLLVDRLSFVFLSIPPAISFNLDNIVLETPAAAPVLEPASLTLLGLGLASMAGRRWRQRKAS